MTPILAHDRPPPAPLLVAAAHVSATARSRARVMSATVSRPARRAWEPGRVGSAELTERQVRRPPSSALASATAWPVVPLPAKKSRTTASSGIVCRIRRVSPVGLGDSKTWPTSAFSSATAVSVDPTSSESQMVRSFLRRSGESQSRWKTSTRSPSRPATTRHTRSSGRSSIRGRDQRHTAGEPSPNTGSTSTEPVERGRRDPPARRVAVDGEVQRPRGHRVELLVGVAQRQVPEAAAVRRREREVAPGRRSRSSSRRGRTARRRGRRPGRTRGWSRSRRRAGGPWG